MRKFLSILSPLLTMLCCINICVAEDQAIHDIFKKNNIEGTIIISSLDGKTEFIHNDQRSEQRFLPASTFKIPNTLIALDTGVINNDKEIIKWDGKSRFLESWNQDQTLTSAFARSCVWCYQEFAKNIGNTEYLKHLNRMNYGNKKTGKAVTTFWLEGNLAISAREQIDFLRKLYLNDLPYDKQHIQLLKKIMIREKTPHYTVYAKTGWATKVEKQHGWFVGYIETDNKVWLFANNISMESQKDLPYRTLLVMESLKSKGIIKK